MNSKRGSVSFEVEGGTYTLALTTNAMVAYEDRYGETVFDALEGMGGGKLNIKRARGLLWATLSGHHELTEEQVGDIMDVIGIAAAAEHLSAVAAASFPESDGDAKAGNGKRPRRTK